MINKEYFIHNSNKNLNNLSFWSILKSAMHDLRLDFISICIACVLGLYKLLRLAVRGIVRIADVFRTTKYAEKKFLVIDEKINEINSKLDKIFNLLMRDKID